MDQDVISKREEAVEVDSGNSRTSNSRSINSQNTGIQDCNSSKWREISINDSQNEEGNDPRLDTKELSNSQNISSQDSDTGSSNLLETGLSDSHIVESNISQNIEVLESKRNTIKSSDFQRVGRKNSERKISLAGDTNCSDNGGAGDNFRSKNSHIENLSGMSDPQHSTGNSESRNVGNIEQLHTNTGHGINLQGFLEEINDSIDEMINVSIHEMMKSNSDNEKMDDTESDKKTDLKDKKGAIGDLSRQENCQNVNTDARSFEKCDSYLFKGDANGKSDAVEIEHEVDQINRIICDNQTDKNTSDLGDNVRDGYDLDEVDSCCATYDRNIVCDTGEIAINMSDISKLAGKDFDGYNHERSVRSCDSENDEAKTIFKGVKHNTKTSAMEGIDGSSVDNSSGDDFVGLNHTRFILGLDHSDNIEHEEISRELDKVIEREYSSDNLSHYLCDTGHHETIEMIKEIDKMFEEEYKKENGNKCIQQKLQEESDDPNSMDDRKPVQLVYANLNSKQLAYKAFETSDESLTLKECYENEEKKLKTCRAEIIDDALGIDDFDQEIAVPENCDVELDRAVRNEDGDNTEHTDLTKTLGKPSDIETSDAMKDKEVVETDAGYYWLTCSIDDGPEVFECINVRTKTQDIEPEGQTLNRDTLHDSYLDSNNMDDQATGYDDVDCFIDNTHVGIDVPSVFKTAGPSVNKDVDKKVKEKYNNVVQELMKSKFSSTTRTTNQEFNDDHSHNTATVVDAFDDVDGAIDKSMTNDSENIWNVLDGYAMETGFDEEDSVGVDNLIEIDDRENIEPENIADVDMDNTRLYRSHSLRNSGEPCRISEDDYLKVSNKDNRKYSCPDNVFRVFKVLSIDMPKVNDGDTCNTSIDKIGVPKSKSCDKFTSVKVKEKNVEHDRRSLEQKKNMILEYLEEISRIGQLQKQTNTDMVVKPMEASDQDSELVARNKENKVPYIEGTEFKGQRGNEITRKKSATHKNRQGTENLNSKQYEGQYRERKAKSGGKESEKTYRKENDKLHRDKSGELFTSEKSLQLYSEKSPKLNSKKSETGGNEKSRSCKRENDTVNQRGAERVHKKSKKDTTARSKGVKKVERLFTPVKHKDDSKHLEQSDATQDILTRPSVNGNKSRKDTSSVVSNDVLHDTDSILPPSESTPSRETIQDDRFNHPLVTFLTKPTKKRGSRYHSRGKSVDMTSTLVQKQPEMLRRKSAELCPLRSDYEDIDDYLDNNSDSSNSTLSKDNNGNVMKNGSVCSQCIANGVIKNGNIPSEGPVELKNMIDLLNSYKTCDYKCVKCHSLPKYDDFPIYATVDKTTKKKVVQESSDMKKVLKKPIRVDPPQVPPPPVPPKPKILSQDFQQKVQLQQSMPQEGDNSPEMQVMINSLSPVLTRRNSKNRRKNSLSVENSPDATPKVSPRIPKNVDSTREKTASGPPQSSSNNSKVGQKMEDPATEKSLFLDPKMAKTWHGATSQNWSSVYGPRMRAMMKEMENDISMDKSGGTISDMEGEELESYEARCRTLPSKSLLDEMHKRFCADQYSVQRNASTLSRSNTLFRLKNSPQISAKRSQSFNIRMGSSSYNRKEPQSANPEPSPLLNRAAERIRIKTRPDVQYSPRLPRTREVTPEAQLSDDSSKAEVSKKEEAEIEAIEACRWLRETGFPQYAQFYEDGQFPVDIETVEKDHDFLDKEDIQSLFRRLNTLNKCAIMKIGTPTKKESEDSDDDDTCALSDKWRYQRSSRRWSRKDLEITDLRNVETSGLKSSSSHDSLLAGQNSSSEKGDSPVLMSRMLHTNEDMVVKTSTPFSDANGNTPVRSPKTTRRANESIRGAKSFLKRMESLKGKRSKKKNKNITDISDPVIHDTANMQAKIKHLNCKDISGKGDRMNTSTISTDSKDVNELITSSRTEALTTVTTSTPKTDSNSNSLVASQNPVSLTVTGDSVDGKAGESDTSVNGALGHCTSTSSRQSTCSDTTNSSQETLILPIDYHPGKFPKLLDDSLFKSDSNIRTRSYSYEDDNSEQKIRRGSHDPRREMHRVSIYDNVPIEEDLATAQKELDIILSELFQNINGLNRAINGDDAELLEPPLGGAADGTDSVTDTASNSPQSKHHTDLDTTHDGDETEIVSGTLSSPDNSDFELHTEETSQDDSSEHIRVGDRERRDSGVGSSLTRSNSERKKYRIRWHSFQKSHRPTSESRNLQLFSLSAGQILMLKKLCLLKLTGLIEKYAPNRSSWSLTVPKFMKRHKVPDYKEKNVFGVPFHVMIQRTGQALPQCILHAMRYLRRTGSDSVGIFRKSGVRSRIQKLRNDIECDPEAVDFESLQAYDVADLVKQYFRELPECLLTTKLSDIFVTIFLNVPADQRLEALQAAVVLMSDENRDVLQSLLLFLSDIALHADKHQMNVSNLAVCFAPSLFNSTRNPSQTPSPLRNRKNAGIPDPRELMEQKAAHECLTIMIQECKQLFTIPAHTLSKFRLLHEDPVSLEELNSQSEDNKQGYTGHADLCIQGLLKESREKFRGWVNMPVHIDVDVAYKKIGDGHPLRLWKCAVDVEAPPSEVLNRILNDRQLWDEDLLQWSTVEKLDEYSDVFQYVRNSMAPHPTREYCVLRSWRTSLPKGACVLISTSIDHHRAEHIGGVRGVELASRYLIEPCGTGKSRLTHISRVDVRGHSPEWYKKVYGHICANFMDKIRSSFHCNTEGPETKV